MGQQKLAFYFAHYYMHTCFSNYCDVAMGMDVSLVFVFNHYHSCLVSLVPSNVAHSMVLVHEPYKN